MKEKQGALIFFGDSITQGWGGGMRSTFDDTLVANRGISGDATRGMLLRLQQDVLDLNPSGVVMLMGTNDLEEGSDPQTIADKLALIVEKIHARNPKTSIVLSLIFPSSESKKRPANKTQGINRLYQLKVKGDRSVHVLDTWMLFANDKKDAKVEEFPDLLHPNDAGYKKWGAALRPVLEVIGLVAIPSEPATSKKIANEAGFDSLFYGKDLTGWVVRPTTAEERKSRDRWQSRDPSAPAWPIIEQAFAVPASGPIGLEGDRGQVEYRNIQIRTAQ